MTSILTISKIFINPLPRRFSKMLTRIPENTKAPPIYHKKALTLALTLFQTFHISAGESDTDPVDLSLFFWHSTFFLIVRLKSKKNIKSLAYQIQFVV